jgi:hypothetical protein
LLRDYEQHTVDKPQRRYIHNIEPRRKGKARQGNQPVCSNHYGSAVVAVNPDPCERTDQNAREKGNDRRQCQRDGGEFSLPVVVHTTYMLSKASFGQCLMHLPQWMHFAGSISGKAYMSFCVMAPFGHTEIAGHLWFCGHFSRLTVIFIGDPLLRPYYNNTSSTHG